MLSFIYVLFTHLDYRLFMNLLSQLGYRLFMNLFMQLGYRNLFTHLGYGLFMNIFPKGRPGMSDVSLLSGISGLSFDSPFLSPLSLSLSLVLFPCPVLLLFLSCHFSANGPFS